MYFQLGQLCWLHCRFRNMDLYNCIPWGWKHREEREKGKWKGIKKSFLFKHKLIFLKGLKFSTSNIIELIETPKIVLSKSFINKPNQLIFNIYTQYREHNKHPWNVAFFLSRCSLLRKQIHYSSISSLFSTLFAPFR